MCIKKNAIAIALLGVTISGCTQGSMADSSGAKSSNSAPVVAQLIFTHDIENGTDTFSVQYDVPGYGTAKLAGAKLGQPVNNMTCTGVEIRRADAKAARSESLVCQGAKLSVRQSTGKDIYDVEFYISRPARVPNAVVKPGYDLVPTSDGSDLLEKVNLPAGTVYRATLVVPR